MTTTQNTSAKTADEFRAEARQHSINAHESFERCDTDGFMSQWASGLSAAKAHLAADIAENGGCASFPALFEWGGDLVPAKLIETRYGYSWGILESDDPRSRIVDWFNPSKARNDDKRIENNARKGFSVGRVMAPAKAELAGANATSVRPIPVRTDGGFSRDVEIVEFVSRYNG